MHDLSYLEALPTLLLEATDYLQLFYREQHHLEPRIEARLAEVDREYRRSQTYTQTTAELSYGAKVAWRNTAPSKAMSLGRYVFRNR